MTPPTSFVIVPTVRSKRDKKPESETTSSKSLENNSENEFYESEESKSINNEVDISEGIPMWTPLLSDMSKCSSLWVNHIENRIKSRSINNNG